MLVKNHNLARGRYRLHFNVGIKDLSMGLRDYDVVHDVLVFNVEYQDLLYRQPYALWQPGWGNHNLKDVGYNVL